MQTAMKVFSSRELNRRLTKCVLTHSQADCGVRTVYKAGVHTGHPLDPLSALEIKLVADQCKAYAAHYGYGPLRFNTIGLKVDVPMRCFTVALAEDT